MSDYPLRDALARLIVAFKEAGIELSRITLPHDAITALFQESTFTLQFIFVSFEEIEQADGLMGTFLGVRLYAK